MPLSQDEVNKGYLQFGSDVVNPTPAPAGFTGPTTPQIVRRYTPAPTPTPTATPTATPTPPATDPSIPAILTPEAFAAGRTGGVDENAIREQTRKNMQATIDAIDSEYANLISSQQQTNEGNMGQTRAVNKQNKEYYAPMQLKDGSLVIVDKLGNVKNLGKYDLPENSSFVFAPDGTPFVFDPTTGKAEIASGFAAGQFAKPDTAKNNIVKINGVDYQVDAQGNYTIPDVPEAKQQATELKTKALQSAKDLLEKFKSGNDSAVGASRLWTAGGLRSLITFGA